MEDKDLFNKIALKYAQKDIYPVSRTVRKFQVETLIGMIPDINNRIFDNIIEIGCGNGANSVYLKKYYRKYTGADFSVELIEIAKKYYTDKNTCFICEDIKNIKPSGFDLIVGIGVLHHLPNLNEYLEHITKISNKDPFFIFLEPQGQNPFIRILRSVRKLVDSSYSKTQRFFSKKDLVNAFEKADLEVIKIKYTGYFSPPFAQVIVKPAFIFLPLVKLLMIADLFIQKFFPNCLSWNLSAAARRKSED
ncbi:MAG: class I SAM-dependent methyltransferase [Candidatus Delongbacteria bacterium]|nr:class I SAM-dependent methyltransferase [Candidatus Delongbacteria bacterium]MDY0016718.1 class I SAM-dependent methyltransferase [Candidatus Delongbacteria bacterium]